MIKLVSNPPTPGSLWDRGTVSATPPQGVRTREEQRARCVVVDALEGVLDMSAFQLRFHDDGLVEVLGDGQALVKFWTGRAGYDEEVDQLRKEVLAATVMES